MPPSIGLSDIQRHGVIQMLRPLLSDEYVLYTKTHNHHWNVVELQFNDLHDLFQVQYTELNKVADDVAERIRALRQPAIGTLAEFVQHTRMKEHPGHYPGARDLLASLLADHEAVIRSLRVDLETCDEEYHDMGTNDFLTGLMARHEKMAWMLRAFMEILTAAVTLLLIMDPLGNIPVFMSVLNQVDPRRRHRVLIRELLISLAVLLAFLFFGRYPLHYLNLQQESIGIAGGIVLFLIALRMIFPQEGGIMGDLPEGEPLIVPLAVPLLAGPSTMATLLLVVRSEPGRLADWLIALMIAWSITAAILLASTFVYRLLRQRGLMAMERLTGLLLVAVAVQMLLSGVADYMPR